MRVVLAKKTSIAPRGDDFNFATPGELLTLPALVCDGPAIHRIRCGCGRSFSGVRTAVASTFGIVAEVPRRFVDQELEGGKLVEGWRSLGSDSFDPREAFMEDMRQLADALKDLRPGTEVRIHNEPNSWRLLSVERVKPELETGG